MSGSEAGSRLEEMTTPSIGMIGRFVSAMLRLGGAGNRSGKSGWHTKSRRIAMSGRFTRRLLSELQSGGLIGARLRATVSGPRVVGTLHGKPVAFDLPRDQGAKLSDGAVRAALSRAVEAAGRV